MFLEKKKKETNFIKDMHTYKCKLPSGISIGQTSSHGIFSSKAYKKDEIVYEHKWVDLRHEDDSHPIALIVKSEEGN
jgi:hypothetical protein